MGLSLMASRHPTRATNQTRSSTKVGYLLAPPCSVRRASRLRQTGDERGDCTVSDVILLEGIQIPAALGVTAAERRTRRPVTLDLEVGLDLRDAGRVDRIQRTVHYKRIFEIVEDVAANQEHQLVEALADRIARAVLSKFDVDFVTVTVRKPTPIAGVLKYAGVRIKRTRQDVS